MRQYGNAGCTRSGKGKARAIEPIFAREDSTPPAAGENGVVLPLTMVSTTSYETVYTLLIQVGHSNQKLYVQVDSGSSDFWIAANSCGSQACKQAGGSLYDPSSSTSANKDFRIPYVEGEAAGPIVWDTVNVGGYTIDTQAMAAANTVDDEPLSSQFSGVLGIALPANSIIANAVPPTTGNTPDGAVLASNLFSMTPASTAPSARFMSLTLARPEDNGEGVASQFGIGKHPPEIVHDPSKIQYDALASPSGNGPLFWQAELSSISLWVDNVEKVVDIGSSLKYPGAAPTAVIDSGMPIILASRNIANAIYGALGIGPGSDGQYYISCTTAINMSIVLDSRTAIPLHPLDLSAGATGNCFGMVQAYPADSAVADIAEIILGVPFMRSTYTVMAYDVPDQHGVFPNATQVGKSFPHPQLGLMGLTDPSKALDEFHTVRVLNQPLPSGVNGANNGGAGSGGGGGVASQTSEKTGGKKLSVGVEILIGLVGFFVLCFLLFAVRWAVHRRKLIKMKRQAIHDRTGSWDAEEGEPKEGGDYLIQQDAALRLVRQSTLNSRYGPSDDTLRSSKYSEFKRLDSGSTLPRSIDSRVRTRVSSTDGEGKDAAYSDKELGYRGSAVPSDFDSKEGDMGMWAMGQATLVSTHGAHASLSGYKHDDERDESEYPHSPGHVHSPSIESASVAVPLLAYTRDESRDEHGAVRKTPLGLGRPPSRARVGSFGSDTRLSSSLDFATAELEPGCGDEGMRTSMAGIGRTRIASASSQSSRHTPRPSNVSVSMPLLQPSRDESHVGVSAEATDEHRGGAL